MEEELKLDATEQLMEAPDLAGDEEIIIPTPLLSICVISSTEDKENRLGTFLKYVPKSTDIELIFVETLHEFKDQENKVIREALRFKQAEYYYKTPYLNFSKARNYAKSLATGTWILALDMDEFVPEVLVDTMLNLLANYKESNINAIMVGIASAGRDFETGQYARVHTEALRIFRNLPEIFFIGNTHETIQFNIGPAEILHTGLVINHFGYDVSREDILKKFDRNLKGLCADLAENNYLDFMKQYFFEYLDDTIQAIKSLRK